MSAKRLTNKQQFTWHEGPVSWRNYFRLVNMATSRIVAEVEESHSGSEWDACLRGFLTTKPLGSFTTKEAAMRAVERAARRLTDRGRQDG